MSEHHGAQDATLMLGEQTEAQEVNWPRQRGILTMARWLVRMSARARREVSTPLDLTCGHMLSLLSLAQPGLCQEHAHSSFLL